LGARGSRLLGPGEPLELPARVGGKKKLFSPPGFPTGPKGEELFPGPKGGQKGNGFPGGGKLGGSFLGPPGPFWDFGAFLTPIWILRLSLFGENFGAPSWCAPWVISPWGFWTQREKQPGGKFQGPNPFVYPGGGLPGGPKKGRGGQKGPPGGPNPGKGAPGVLSIFTLFPRGFFGFLAPVGFLPPRFFTQVFLHLFGCGGPQFPAPRGRAPGRLPRCYIGSSHISEYFLGPPPRGFGLGNPGGLWGPAGVGTKHPRGSFFCGPTYRRFHGDAGIYSSKGPARN